MAALALDGGVAVALLLTSHVAHADVRQQLSGRPVALTGHSLAETYLVLTRLPGDARLAPHDASRLLADRFGEPALLSAEQTASLPSILAPLGIAGGAVYDALVALAAIAAGRTVVTRDNRAASTYAALSAHVEFIQLAGVYAASAGDLSADGNATVATCYSQRMATTPTRIDVGLFNAARQVGALHSRSATQQLDHWARLGRELEASPATTHDAIERVLSGQLSYDELPGPAQAVVRVAWDDQMARRAAALDFSARLRDTGAPWPESDDDGRVVMRGPAAPEE